MKRNRITVIAGALISMFAASSSLSAFAYRLDDDTRDAPAPLTHAVTQATSGGSKSWLVALLVFAGIAAAATLIGGLVRSRRERRYAITPQW